MTTASAGIRGIFSGAIAVVILGLFFGCLGEDFPNITKDQCPGTKEDPDGFQDADGCPDDDNDADGVPDTLDGLLGGIFPQCRDIAGPPATQGCPDGDADRMADLWEGLNGLDSMDAADSAFDGDGDSLSNLTEFTLGTNPASADTDGDGLEDG